MIEPFSKKKKTEKNSFRILSSCCHPSLGGGTWGQFGLNLEELSSYHHPSRAPVMLDGFALGLSRSLEQTAPSSHSSACHVGWKCSGTQKTSGTVKSRGPRSIGCGRKRCCLLGSSSRHHLRKVRTAGSGDPPAAVASHVIFLDRHPGIILALVVHLVSSLHHPAENAPREKKKNFRFF